MQWLEHMNEALKYIEDNLDGEVSLNRVGQLSCSSTYHFQRMFSYITDVPLSEYIRRRRLTKAAFDLQDGGKVIDVATRYGYDSPTAFNRAFQAVHGITPSAAQQSGAKLKAYPRISFQVTIKGGVEMEYKIITRDAFRVVGVREPILMGDGICAEESFKHIPDFWKEVGASGKIPEILQLMNKEPRGLLGVSSVNESADNFYYIAVSTDRPAPDGMYALDVPACTWVVFPGEGKVADLQDLQKRIMLEWLPTSGYEWADAPDIEVYLNDDPIHMKYDIWVPVVKKP